MDLIDQVFYEGATCEEELARAYSMLDSKEGRMILKDLMVYTGWGAQDPTSLSGEDAKAVLTSQRVLWRIKAMLNCKPEKMNEGDDNE